MIHLRLRDGLSSIFVLLIAALGPAMAQEKPPWETAGHAFHGNPVGYARSIHERYLRNRNALVQERAHLGQVRSDLAHYQGTGVIGGLAAAHNDPDRFVALGEVRRTVAALEQERNEMEREWAQWCEWSLRLGPLSDANETIEDPYLDHTVFPAALKTQKRDKIDFRIRYFLEKVEYPREIQLPDELGQIEDAGGAVLVPSSLAGPARVGQQVMQQGGSFPGEESDQDIKVGPFEIPQACTIKAHVIGNPPVPNVWSLGNANTGMSVVYERRLGMGHASGAQVIGLSGQTTNNDLSGEADLPGPGRLTVIFGHPRGSGPLSGGNFSQGFSGDIVITKIATELPATARTALRHGDRIRAAKQPPPSVSRTDPTSSLSRTARSPSLACAPASWG